MMNQPIMIGVTPLYDTQRDSVWMVPGYLNGILDAGGIPIILPLTSNMTKLRALFDSVDGILFTGGQDVDPASYGEAVRQGCGELCKQRDAMEEELLRLCRIKKKPAYGICRGIQFFNAMLGGTLYQHIPDELPGAVEHHMKPPYDRVAHTVTVERDSLLYHILGRNEIGVNSYHHQGVKELAPSLTASAWAPDGLIEAIEDRRHPFFLATQWHPEFFWEKDDSSRRLFHAFVRACDQCRNSLVYALGCDIL
ncbi:MAG: gamma-glutamyl-gamma-aminobutyrate hydrolase family protein [Eubacteriales bacterium]|nr:gamma-glutamyl-gamma-aminobutyrate hydrolase family protein [Eubacteriales bacterium]